MRLGPRVYIQQHRRISIDKQLEGTPDYTYARNQGIHNANRKVLITNLYPNDSVQHGL